ncbi:DUF4365 domain-containing protein [Mesorhizobium sp.]|uniref:DUF4365 domain-containing protein n=1 Tax=Mesorhizobium sp. TaxID=1871066 RepID=UPI0025F0FBBD|nr:DUF4365 domain-containing protein [Mesorhizobium sp.]
MKVTRKDAVSQSGVGWLHFAVTSRLGWIFREQPSQDKGVDAHIEEVVEGRATGRLIGLQIKSGMSWFRERTRGGFLFRGNLEHLSYWRGHSLPIIVVVFNPDDQEAYWQIISERYVRENEKGWSLTVPYINKITPDIVPTLTEICSPESRKKFFKKRAMLYEIASIFQENFDGRQSLLYNALHLVEHSLFVAVPYIDAAMLSVLDFLSCKTKVYLAIGSDQSKEVRNLLRAGLGKGIEVRIFPGLHLKCVIFDSLLVMDGSANLTSVSLSSPQEQFSFLVEEASCQAALERFFDIWSGRHGPFLDPTREALIGTTLDFSQ